MEEFVGADVTDRSAVEVTVERPVDPALICCRQADGLGGIDGRARGGEGHGRRRAAVVAERGQQRIGGDEITGANL